MKTDPENTPPENKEECRFWMIARCEERIANMRRMANEARKAGDDQNVVLARHVIGQNARFLEKLRKP